jgi:hypothetical protein
VDRLSEDLNTVVAREVADYNQVRHWKAQGYYVEDPAQQLYMVVEVPHHDHPEHDAAIIVMARIVENTVIIDTDITDKPLYKELLRCGVPRSQIILRYAGETAPELSDEDDDEN